MGFLRAKSQREGKKKGIDKGNGKERERTRKSNSLILQFLTRFCLTTRSVVWLFLQSGIQRVIHPGSWMLCVCKRVGCEVRTGLLPQTCGGREASQHSRNPQVAIFCRSKIMRGSKQMRGKVAMHLEPWKVRQGELA